MPTWWSKKSIKTKEHPRGGTTTAGTVLHFNFTKSPIRNSTNTNNVEKPKSFDDVSAFRNSPRPSRDFTSSTSAAAGSSSCCDSDAGDKIGIPLPRPSVYPTQSLSNDQGLTFGSTSVSSSSVSSNGSYDDPSTCNSQINSARLVA